MPIPPSTPPPEVPRDFDEPPAVTEPAGRTSKTFDHLREFRADAVRAKFEYVSDARIERAARDIFAAIASMPQAEQQNQMVLTVAQRVFMSLAPPSVDAQSWRDAYTSLSSLSSSAVEDSHAAMLPISNSHQSRKTELTAPEESWMRMTEAVLDITDAWAEQRRGVQEAMALRSLFYDAFRVDRNRPRGRPRK